MVERGETRLDAEARVAYAAAPGSVDDGLENEIGSASMNRRIILVIGSLILLWSPIALGQQQTTSPPNHTITTPTTTEASARTGRPHPVVPAIRHVIRSFRTTWRAVRGSTRLPRTSIRAFWNSDRYRWYGPSAVPARMRAKVLATQSRLGDARIACWFAPTRLSEVFSDMSRSCSGPKDVEVRPVAVAPPTEVLRETVDLIVKSRLWKAEEFVEKLGQPWRLAR